MENKDEDLRDECLETIGESDSAETCVVEESEEEIKIAELEKKYDDSIEKLQRTLAEFDNFRKRTSKEKASMYDDGVRDTVEKLLPAVDNIERALSAQESKVDPEDPFLKGVKMTLKQLNEILSGMGIESIPALGEKFDPSLHAAVAHEDSDEFGENEIMIEMLKGYKYKDKVIRHSMVKVAN